MLPATTNVSIYKLIIFFIMCQLFLKSNDLLIFGRYTRWIVGVSSSKWYNRYLTFFSYQQSEQTRRNISKDKQTYKSDNVGHELTRPKRNAERPIYNLKYAKTYVGN